MSETKEEGWGLPLNSKKAHYFVGARSLCNRWMFMGKLEGDEETSSDDCAQLYARTCQAESCQSKGSPTIEMTRGETAAKPV